MPPRHTSAAKAVAAAPRSSRLTLRELVALGIVCLLGIFCFEFLIEGSVTSEHVNVGTTAAHDKHLQHAASLESGLHRLETKLDSMMYRVNLLGAPAGRNTAREVGSAQLELSDAARARADQVHDRRSVSARAAGSRA